MIIINLQDIMFPFCFQKRKKAYESSKFRGSTASNKEYFINFPLSNTPQQSCTPRKFPWSGFSINVLWKGMFLSSSFSNPCDSQKWMIAEKESNEKNLWKFSSKSSIWPKNKYFHFFETLIISMLIGSVLC